MSTDRGIHLRRSQDPGAFFGGPGVLESDVGTPKTSEGSAVSGGAEPSMRGDDVLVLIADLCRSLDAERVRYCHWKSNEAIARSANGENDLDLLVHRSDAERFEGILRQLGFKDTVQPGWKQLPGVYHSYGLDPPTGALVHIHAHYQLVVGDDMTKNIHLPVEESYIASSTPDRTFMIPSPAFELALFLIRMTVKHCTWDAFVTLQGSLSRSERRELDDLLGHVDLDEVWAFDGRAFPLHPARAVGSLSPIREARIVTLVPGRDGEPPPADAGGLEPPPAACSTPRCGCGGASGPCSGGRSSGEVRSRVASPPVVR